MPGLRDRPRAADQAEQQPATGGQDRPTAHGRERAQDSAVPVDAAQVDAVRVERPEVTSAPDGVRRPAARVSERDGERSGRYDADAEFKRPVSKPPGYLPDDTGGRSSPGGALREGRDRGPGTGWPDGPAEISRPPRRDGPGIVLPESREDIRRSGLDWETGSHEAADGGEPDALRAEAVDGDGPDVLQAVIDRPHFYDLLDNSCPDRYGDPLTRPDGTRYPCLEGPPRREQTRQGWAGDCGIIAALGAVAAYQPEEITRRISPQEDGSYKVTLSETRWSEKVAIPTGRDIELTITPELPVNRDDPGTPACAKAEDGAAWCAIFEKAFAGIDQTWTAQRQIAWMDEWAGLCAQDKADMPDEPEKQRSGPPPEGYVRLHQGTSPWERAEVLTQLTGQAAVVCEFPSGEDEWRINRVIRAQLTEDKPVLVASRRKTHEGEQMPHGLEPEHVYEVTGIEKGKIILRNPWNYKHPEPMETDEFARNLGRYYSTLK